MSARNATNVKELARNVDDVFLLTNAIFVCLMQCGFACLEAGSIRSKNVTNIMMKNLLDIFVSCLAYWLIGYAVAYGDGNAILGLTYWAGAGIPADKYSHWFFQFVFAATAATIVSGAVAERCNFVAYLVYSAVISGFVYPVVSHWVWSESGWLYAAGYEDFAGSGAVHMLGGACSLVGAAVLGPRTGRFDGGDMSGHSVPLIGIGGLMLIAGFLAFNGGSLGSVSAPGAGATASVVVANTMLSGTAAAGVVLVAARLGCAGPPAWSFCLTLNGALAGMVSVCAAADVLRLWSSFAVGLVAGAAYLLLHRVVPACKIDDPLDAVAVHLGGGLWGVLAGPIFAGFNLPGLWRNAIGALAIFAWSAATSAVTFGALKWTGHLRASLEDEILGLDAAEHKQPAYSIRGDGTESSSNPEEKDCVRL